MAEKKSTSSSSSIAFPIPPLVFKYILVGPVAVGKSALLFQFTENCFSETHDITIGVEFGTYMTNVDGQPIKLQVWDTCGQQSFRSITRSYYRGAQGVLLVYDVTRRESFEYLSSWLTECLENGDSNITIVLVGNKCDLSAERVISYEEGKKFADEHNILFLETSAKTAVNVEEAFVKTSKIIYDKYSKGLIRLDNGESIKGASMRDTGRRNRDSGAAEKEKGCCD